MLKNLVGCVAVDGVEKIIIYANRGDNERKVNKRSSYRGVTMNGHKWQTLVMGNNCKYYSKSLANEKFAARVYDRFALQN